VRARGRGLAPLGEELVRKAALERDLHAVLLPPRQWDGLPFPLPALEAASTEDDSVT
jgi:hypothetical protein